MTSAAPTHSDSNKLEQETVLRDALAAAQALFDDGRRAFARVGLAPNQPETLLPKLDMEFAQEGGKEPTLLHAALVGDSTRVTRQGVEKTWRIKQALLDAPPPVHMGPAEGRRPARGGRWHGPWVTA